MFIRRVYALQLKILQNVLGYLDNAICYNFFFLSFFPYKDGRSTNKFRKAQIRKVASLNFCLDLW